MGRRERGQDRRGSRRGGHKSAQLCAQVGEAVSMALASEFDDPVLQSLVVYKVRPAPNEGHLLVTVYPGYEVEPLALAETQSRLDQVKHMIRDAIAMDIHRKRLPDLSFQVVPASAAVY